ncbi:glycosyltransferase family 4 protein [Patescibacteria group bacterium]|nr:glycosyltransferase family 4 protein [Patescibacteria group bacterium]
MPLKVGIYDPYLDTLGGGERYMLTIAEILLKHNYQVDIFWSKDKDLIDKAQDRFALNLENLNLVPDIFSQPQQNIDLIQDHSQLKKINSTQKETRTNLGKVKHLLNKLKITRNYNLFFYLSDGSIPILFAKKNILHCQVPFTNKFSFQTKIANKLKLFLNKNIICNSIFTQDQFKKTFHHKSSLLYPPIDTDKFSASGKKENIILSVGRFDNILNKKRQDILIKAFKKLSQNQNNKDWKLILVGGSIKKPELNNYLKHLKYEAKNFPIEFLIGPNFDTLKKIYSQSKIYWHAAGFGVDENINPQNTEHFGMAVVEAMASGTIPIVVKKGGLPEIINERENGFLWSDIDELVSKTQLLIGSPQLMEQLSVQTQQDSAKFSKQNFEKKLLEIIN